ncbi:MAG TPA: hypothetical protein VGE79_00610, partial [Niastella sp.]
MSTNNGHTNGTPDIKWLEQLANQFFKTVPNDTSSIPTYNIDKPASGVSPSAPDQGNVKDISH